MRCLEHSHLFWLLNFHSVSLYQEKTKRNHVDLSKQYLAFVMLFLAATSLAVRGSGSDVGMGEFWKESRRTQTKMTPTTEAGQTASF